jgi:hypothetical protein
MAISLIGWKYRKQINITGQSGAGTNYQVLLKIGESIGSSNVDFNLDMLSAKFPSAKNDGGDLRFTSSDGITLLNFWVEDVSGTAPNRVAKIWVKVADDLGTNKSIYCYYGNFNTHNASNGDGTFLLFDDFEGTGDVDNSKWGTVYTVSLQGNSIARVGGTASQYNGLFSLNAFGEKYSVIAYTNIYGTTVGRHYSGAFGSSLDCSSYVGYATQWNSPYQLFVYGDGLSISLPSPFDNAYHRFETKRKGNGKAELLVDNISKASASSGAYTEDYPIASWAYQSDYNYIDYIAVRKCQEIEPTFNSANKYETLFGRRRIFYVPINTSNFFHFFN